jgi:PiT family inorganic phosphate transporter
MATAVILAATVLVIILAIIFAFTNGFNDASATVATLISSGIMSPRTAVIFSAILGFAGAALGGSAVAFTIQNLVTGETGEILVIALLASVLAAVMWNLVGWRTGLPTSSTHALVGGLIGAGIAATGAGSVLWGVDELFSNGHQLVGVMKVFVFLVASVVIGFVGGFVAMRLSSLLLRNATQQVNRPIKGVQWFTAGLVAFTHGANDTQKQMALIALVLFAAGFATSSDIPVWARTICALAIAIGTVGGGWRIMTTIGRRIYRIKPIHSLDSQVPSALSIAVSTLAGAPVSSSQIVASSVLGVGAAENRKLVQWRVGRDMLLSWFLTIPACMLISGVAFTLLRVLLLPG